MRNPKIVLSRLGTHSARYLKLSLIHVAESRRVYTSRKNGTTKGKQAGMNRVVGVTSWGYVNRDIKSQGASRFTKTYVKGLVDAVCGEIPNPC